MFGKILTGIVPGHFIDKKLKSNRKHAIRKEARRLNESKNPATPAPAEDFETEQQNINRLSEESRQRDIAAREEGRKYGEELINRKVQGISPEERNALQESANAQIGRDIHGHEKRILAQQGKRGIRGGAAYAQRQDLARLGTEAQQQVQRDLTSLDRDLAMRKLAALYNVEQGERGQAAIRHQGAKDTAEAYNQRKYQKWLADQANKIFARI